MSATQITAEIDLEPRGRHALYLCLADLVPCLSDGSFPLRNAMIQRQRPGGGDTGKRMSCDTIPTSGRVSFPISHALRTGGPVAPDAGIRTARRLANCRVKQVTGLTADPAGKVPNGDPRIGHRWHHRPGRLCQPPQRIRHTA
ncbi:hypothetical protein PZ897_05825 [Hoeflea sp. YIM 152468]|uniref:hypothetical protein n=1 Tax=Hoeflea sp. YIM 152468 TaxID=3031759 RepID=UPI0023DB3B35|nr:hypothetical protein [Hoeflea sp. YIM 152468]MDF1607691.1 hypothetical protein [Hoeflea sp. YIM 152468]